MRESSAAPAASVVRRAIDWHIQLESSAGADHDRIRTQIARWCAEREAHALAWARIARLTGEFDDMVRQLPEPSASLDILGRAEREVDRRRAMKLMLGGLAIGGAGLWFARPRLPWQADYVTGTGEQRHLRLDDGTSIMLNTDSALNVAFTPDERRLILKSGEIMIESGPDTGSPHHRPLRLSCRHGMCEALGTRFSVRDEATYSQLSVSEGRVALDPLGAARRILERGETVRFDGTTSTSVTRPVLDPDAWSRGMLAVRDIRLARFLKELARYRHGVVGCDERIADLRLSGVFQLDDQARLLRHLERTLPIRIVSRTRWWVRAEPA
ncbi:FecR domain-containing protein [Salinicola rhizosphaerae]|uniref:Anti-sigma factor FoxR n=1 Tax=Salinicola rhizosphaerae TaxID=1443141 RepID=A0ABQ3E217_9GAMM|nr:FecR domain-containing protein [Salinicola rhizosphaerae]GHB18472.1 anti-sigma factor FoxR [Salinicola rhizosphaerae]